MFLLPLPSYKPSNKINSAALLRPASHLLNKTGYKHLTCPIMPGRPKPNIFFQLCARVTQLREDLSTPVGREKLFKLAVQSVLTSAAVSFFMVLLLHNSYGILAVEEATEQLVKPCMSHLCADALWILTFFISVVGDPSGTLNTTMCLIFCARVAKFIFFWIFFSLLCSSFLVPAIYAFRFKPSFWQLWRDLGGVTVIPFGCTLASLITQLNFFFSMGFDVILFTLWIFFSTILLSLMFLYASFPLLVIKMARSRGWALPPLHLYPHMRLWLLAFSLALGLEIYAPLCVEAVYICMLYAPLLLDLLGKFLTLIHLF